MVEAAEKAIEQIFLVGRAAARHADHHAHRAIAFMQLAQPGVGIHVLRLGEQAQRNENEN